MRSRRLPLLLALFPSLAFPQRPVNIVQLEQLLSAGQNTSDKELTRQINDVELTERLTTAQLERLQTSLSGDQSRLALLAVADASAFKELAPQEVSLKNAPGLDTQGRILSRAMDFTATAMAKMPDFLATRTTTRFRNFRHLTYAESSGQIILLPFQIFVDRSNAEVVFRDGKEVIEPERAAQKQAPVQGLVEWGEFGPLLGTAMSDMAKGKVQWGGWELGPGGRELATFHYAVDESNSHFVVRYCCTINYGYHEFQAKPSYQGEITIDPGTGVISRLIVKANLKPSPLIDRADIVVEFGPIDIGGKTYICPTKSISVARAKQWAAQGDPYGNSGRTGTVVDNPKVTSINDTRFTNYHVFRSEIRISGDLPD